MGKESSVSLLVTLNKFSNFSSVFNIDFEPANVKKE